MKIKVYIHAMDITPRGFDILFEQVKLLESTQLIDNVDEVNVMCHYNIDSYNWLKERWKDRTNVYYEHFDESYKEWYEATTIHRIQEDAHNQNWDYYVLNITSKGISHADGPHQNWRRYMQYWNIERWKDCVAKLDEGYDTVGCAYLNNPPYPFYAGTFFWAKSSYLRKCRRLDTPESNNYVPQFAGQPHHRFDYECWIGSGDPKWYDMHPGQDNRWYLPRETYAE